MSYGGDRRGLTNGAGRSGPAWNLDSEAFWNDAQDGRFSIQHCRQCDDYQHPPAPVCLTCGSFDLNQEAMSGRGSVFSYAIHHEPAVVGFDPPYAIAIVQLEHGIRFVTNIVDIPMGEIKIGLPVMARFIPVGDDRRIPVFGPADHALESTETREG